MPEWRLPDCRLSTSGAPVGHGDDRLWGRRPMFGEAAARTASLPSMNTGGTPTERTGCCTEPARQSRGICRRGVPNADGVAAGAGVGRRSAGVTPFRWLGASRRWWPISATLPSSNFAGGPSARPRGCNSIVHASLLPVVPLTASVTWRCIWRYEFMQSLPRPGVEAGKVHSHRSAYYRRCALIRRRPTTTSSRVRRVFAALFRRELAWLPVGY